MKQKVPWHYSDVKPDIVETSIATAKMYQCLDCYMANTMKSREKQYLILIDVALSVFPIKTWRWNTFQGTNFAKINL